VIAIVAWGSLVWRPTNCGVTLQLRSAGQWEQDGPSLPVEFARISRDGCLTLVVVPDYPHRVTTLWSVSAQHDLVMAIQNLAGRECITENLESIHGVDRDGNSIGTVDAGIASAVHGWLSQRPSLGAAIWTGLGTQPSRWRGHGYDAGFTADNALSYLRSLEDDQSHPAFDYMRRAPEQITTPVRRRAHEEGIV
jgi:hypothetical protein